MMGVDKSQNPKIDFDTPNNIKMVAPTFDRTKNLSSESESDSIISAESVQNLSIVSAKLINVDNFLKDSLVLDKTKAGIEREKAEQDKRDAKEDKEDAPKGKWDLPGRGFLKKAKNWIMNLLFGWLVISLFKNIGQLGGFISTLIKATEFIMEWGGKFLNFFATAIDVAYDAYDKTREWVRKIAGDKGVEVFDGVSKWMNILINGIAAIGIAFASMVMWWPKGPGLGRGKGRFGRVKPKGNVRSWKNRNRFRNPFRKKPIVSQGVGGSQNKFRFRNPFRKKPVVTQGVGGRQGNWFANLQRKFFKRNPVTVGKAGTGKGFFGFLKNIKIPAPKWLTGAKGNALLNTILAYFEFKGRKASGESNLKAISGTTSSTVGGLAGFWAGAKLGAAAGGSIGALFGGVGAAPGALIGGIIGGVAGSMGGSWLLGSASDATVDQIEKPKGENNQWWDFMDLFPDPDKESKKTNINKVDRGENQWWDFMDVFPNKEENTNKVESISQFPSYDDNEVQVSFVTLPPQVVPFTSQQTDEGQFPIIDSSASGSSPYESLYAGGLYS